MTFAISTTTDLDRAFLKGANGVAYVERDWLDRLKTARLCRYALDPRSFECLYDAGMWISRQEVPILSCRIIADLPQALAVGGVILRVVDDLSSLKSLWSTTLHTSGLRLRNARNWQG